MHRRNLPGTWFWRVNWRSRTGPGQHITAVPCSQWSLGTRPLGQPLGRRVQAERISGPQRTGSGKANQECVFAQGRRTAWLQTSQRTSCFQEQRALLPSPDGAGEAPGHGSLAFGPSGRAGLGMGCETPSPNQEEPTAGLRYTMTRDLWGQPRGASFSPCSHPFQTVTKILGLYYYFMFFPVVFRIILSESHSKGRPGTAYLSYFRSDCYPLASLWVILHISEATLLAFFTRGGGQK